MALSIRSILVGAVNLFAILLLVGTVSAGISKEHEPTIAETDIDHTFVARHYRQLSGKGKGSIDCVTLDASPEPSSGKGKGGKGKGSSSEAPVSLKCGLPILRH